MAAGARVNGFLGPPKTAGYAPKVHGGVYWGINSQKPPFLSRYIEQMREDPQVQFGLRAIYGPLGRVKATCTYANSATVKRYVRTTLKRLLKKCMPHLRQCIEYGHAAGEPEYSLKDEKLWFDRLKEWHPLDISPMALKGRLVGVEVRNVEGQGRVEVGAPRYVWVANDPRPGSLWGRSRLANAWEPWMEKTGRQGARDIRRLHFFKNALRGDVMYYPEGQSNTGTTEAPLYVNNQDLARQLNEQMMSGGTLAIPGMRDLKGEREWEVKAPQSINPPDKLLDWLKDLDLEILKALGVPPEVLQAADGTGLSQGGRAIPLSVFYDMLDELARLIIEALDKHILRWLVRANFGRRARYELEPESLAPPAPPGPGSAQAGQGAPRPPAGPGRPGRQPYVGPRVGRGYKLASGRIKYGLSRSLGGRVRSAARRTDTRHLAKFYSSLWNLLQAAGQHPPESEVEKASAELARGRWAVAFDRRRGKWVTFPAGPDETKVQMSVEHAPVGGVTLNGKFYVGGQFIPGAVMANLPPEERAKLAQAKAASRENLRTRAEPHVAGIRERLGAYAGEPLDKRATKSAAAALRQLQRHHGDLTRHRIAELTHFLENALGKVPEDEEGLRGQFRQRLAALHRMEGGLEAHQPKQPEAAAAPTAGDVRNVPTKDLHIDPVRFQFKLGVNKEGVGQELKSVKQFNPELGGVLGVWQDPDDGKTYVVNGHHRHELAERTGHPALDVRYIKAKDAKEARAKGALINIAEGRGTPVDAAKFMRDTGYTPDDLAKEGISLTGNVARDAVHLAKLSDGLFNRVATGEMDTNRAAAIGAALEDHGLQDQLAKWIDKKEEKTGREYSPKVVAEMAREIAATPKTSKTETTLWGEESSDESLFGERNELKAHVRGELSKEHKDFQTVASERRAGVVGKAGNVLNVEANKAAATEAGQAKNTFDTLMNLKGPVSDALNEYAEKYSHAKGQREREAVRKDAVAAVRQALSGAQPPGTEGVGEGSAAARQPEPEDGSGATGQPLTDAEKEARLAEHAETVKGRTPDPFYHDDPNEPESIKKDRIRSYQSEYPESVARERAAANKQDPRGPEPVRPAAPIPPAAKPEPMPSAAHVTKPKADDEWPAKLTNRQRERLETAERVAIGRGARTAEEIAAHPGVQSARAGILAEMRGEAEPAAKTPTEAPYVVKEEPHPLTPEKTIHKAYRPDGSPMYIGGEDRADVERKAKEQTVKGPAGGTKPPLPGTNAAAGETPAVPDSHAPVGSETADLDNQFHMLEMGQLGYVGGYPVRRTGRREYRLETDKYHVTGDMATVAERIRRNWADQKPEAKAVNSALARAAAYEEPNPFTDAGGSDRDFHARQNLPKGTRVVSLDSETRGRVGTVTYKGDDDGGRVQIVSLDGSPDTHATDFEPLNAADSWRAGNRPAAPPQPKPVQQPLFGDTSAAVPSTPEATATAPAPTPATPPRQSKFDGPYGDRFRLDRGEAGQRARDAARGDLTKRLTWDKDPANVASVMADLDRLTAIDGKRLSVQGQAATPAQPQPPAAPPARGVHDFGEKIGGARKETARPLGPRTTKAEAVAADETAAQPGWRKRYKVSQITGSTRPDEVGKWAVYDMRQTDYLNRPRLISSKLFDSQAEADAAVPLAEVARNHGITSRGTNEYHIYRKVAKGKYPVVRGGFKSYEEAQQWMATHPEEVITHAFPRYETYQYLDSVTRSGGKDRKDDVTPDAFRQEFGFRGGEFGHWQTNRDGQTSLNHAHDALHDLADVLGVNRKSVSLGGKLAMAFGARGTGGLDAARAHYEPDKRVINLTKMKGAGTLSHEWAHAFDHAIDTAMGGGKDYASERRRGSESGPVLKAVHDVMDAITSVEAKSSAADDEKSAQQRHEFDLGYIKGRFSGIEGGLQPSQYRKVKPFTPEQQAEWDRLKEQIVAGDVGEKYWHESKTGGRLTGYETYPPLARMNELYKAATGRSFHTSDHQSQGHAIVHSIRGAQKAKEQVEAARAGQGSSRRTHSEFLREARKLDETRTSDYYSEPREMFARAFEAYVLDKLQNGGRKSDYLVAKADNKFYALIGAKPYPEGEERKAIGAAFDKLMSAVRNNPDILEPKPAAMSLAGEDVEYKVAAAFATLVARHGFAAARAIATAGLAVAPPPPDVAAELRRLIAGGVP